MVVKEVKVKQSEKVMALTQKIWVMYKGSEQSKNMFHNMCDRDLQLKI